MFAPAYPPADGVVRDHLLLAPGTANEADCKAYLRSFLSALFTSALRLLSQFSPPGETMTYINMAKAFYDFFADPPQRDRFYGEVVAHARTGRYTEVWATFMKLEVSLKQRCSDWPPAFQCPLLISMDEVHVLYTPRGVDDGSQYSLYSRLRSVVNEGVTHNLAIISLSTASHVSRLDPSKEMAPSMRERDDERVLPAPFTELPFDAHIIAEPLVPGQSTLMSVGSLEFTAKFGRPL
jgi:hypothetical protein